MPKKGESPYKRTVGLDVPHPFAKEVKKKRPRGRPAKQGPPPPPKKVVKPPRRIVLPTGRDMDEAIIKIQKQFLLDKKNLKRKNGGYTVTNRFSDAMLPEKKRTTRIT